METFHSEAESDTEEAPPEPWDLRQMGNELYQKGNYEEAIEIWLSSVKESLKRSCRMPSAQLYENQLICRLNMSMAYLKLGDWVEAKEQAELVLEQRPFHVKALFRLAQALEHLQEWSKCGKVLQRLLNVARKASGEEPQRQGKEQEDAPSDDDQNDPIDLAGYTPQDIVKLVAQIRQKIISARTEYEEKQTKVMRKIGKRFSEIGTSVNRVVPPPESTDALLGQRPSESTKTTFCKTNPAHVVQWLYQKDQESSDIAQCLENATHAQETTSHSTMQLTAEKVFKDTDAATSCKDDDPLNTLWTTSHDATFFATHLQPRTLSLPLSLARIIEVALTTRLKDEDQKLEENGCYTEDHWNDASPLGQFRRRLVDAVCHRQCFTIHVLGARGDVEMESHWTVFLRRVPQLKHLRIVFIGFVDADDRWARSLREGIISPPLTKSQGLQNGQRVTCWLYKGLYQLFLEEHPDVLSNTNHGFHPDLILIPEPRLSRYFDTWIPVFNQLLDFNIPTVFTGYSALDFASHDAANLPLVLRELEAQWVVPLQPNVYRISVIPDPSLPPMPLWRLSGEPPLKYSGASAKHAVIGCVLGRKPAPNSEVFTKSLEDLKTLLREKCDIESESIELADAEKPSILHNPTQHCEASP